MEILPIHSEIVAYLKKHNLTSRFSKQLRFLRNDVRYSSLEVELLEPKHLRFF